jgi:hypothetical protein
MIIKVEINGKPIDVEIITDIRVTVLDADFEAEGYNSLEITYKINHEGVSIDLVDGETGEVVGDSASSHWDYVAEHTPVDDLV